MFLSSSSAVFDTIPDECFALYNFHLLKISSSSVIEDRLTNKDLVIMDTYSLGIDFLNRTIGSIKEQKLPVLVVDDFREEAVIRQIFEIGVKGYLNIDEYGDALIGKIQRLLPSSTSVRL